MIDLSLLDTADEEVECMTDEEYELWSSQYDAFRKKTESAIYCREYSKVLDLCVEYVDLFEHGNAMAEVLEILHLELFNRLKVLDKVRKIAMKTAIEDLREYDRTSFLRKKLSSSCRTSWSCKHQSYLWGSIRSFSDIRLDDLLRYPVYLLGIRRCKRMYSPEELAFIREWGLVYIPEWLRSDLKRAVHRPLNHSSGSLRQFLGKDGEYSTHNKMLYELKPTCKFL